MAEIERLGLKQKEKEVVDKDERLARQLEEEERLEIEEEEKKKRQLLPERKELKLQRKVKLQLTERSSLAT